jgi:hypothetical protein
MISTNPLIQSSYAVQQQQQAINHMNQSKLNKKKGKNQSIPNHNNTNHSFALYNQQNGRIGKYTNILFLIHFSICRRCSQKSC